MMKDTFYSTTTLRPFEKVCQRVESKAALEGFRVLQVYDLGALLKEKGFTVEPTAVFEVCNAALAAEALKLDNHAALMMPCKIVVQQRSGEVTLSAFLPEALVPESIQPLAHQVGVKLLSLVDTAASSPSCCAI